MVQRDGQKQSWMTSWGHTLIGIVWHPFGVLEADDNIQNNHWQFGNQLLFINYIFMKKWIKIIVYKLHKRDVIKKQAINNRDFQWRHELPPCMVKNTALSCLVGHKHNNLIWQ
jgi:hypothetical protein